MENRIAMLTFRWKIFRAFSVAWLLLTLVFIALLLPKTLLSIGILGSVLGVFFGALGVMRGRSRWIITSLVDACVVFFLLVLSEASSKTLGQYLPITLLQFVMILYAVEVLTVTYNCQNQFSSDGFQPDPVDTISPKRVLYLPTEQAFQQISRLSLLFASCYLISVGILYVGSLVSSLAPQILDMSLYVIVVSISLALLIVLRED